MQIDERTAEAAGPPCVGCRHYQPPERPRGSYPLKHLRPAICTHIAHVDRLFDATIGTFHEREETTAETSRAEDGLCGPEGLLFEPKTLYQRAVQAGYGVYGSVALTAVVLYGLWNAVAY